jgi:hypothetical protein
VSFVHEWILKFAFSFHKHRRSVTAHLRETEDFALVEAQTNYGVPTATDTILYHPLNGLIARVVQHECQVLGFVSETGGFEEGLRVLSRTSGDAMDRADDLHNTVTGERVGSRRQNRSGTAMGFGFWGGFGTIAGRAIWDHHGGPTVCQHLGDWMMASGWVVGLGLEDVVCVLLETDERCMCTMDKLVPLRWDAIV